MESHAYSLSDMESEGARMTDVEAARQALAEVGAIRGQVADKVRCPPSWHIAMGLILGAMVASQALSTALSMAVTAICLCATVLMMQAARRRMGFFVNGYRRGKTLWVALGLLVFAESMLALGIWLKLGLHLPWGPVACGVLVVPVSIGASYLWQSVYRA